MNIDLSLLSKYRTQLMGFAMLWVVLFHYNPSINNGYIKWLISIGYGGVDIFLLLSGLGIYISWNKRKSIIHFYQKRIFRILPIYITLTTAAALIEIKLYNEPFIHIIKTLLWIDFFNAIYHTYSTAWFIPSILLLYLITPFILKYIIRPQKVGLSIALLIIASLIFNEFMSINHIQIWKNGFMDNLIVRFPIYLLGIYFGYLISLQKTKMPSPIAGIWLTLSILSGIYFYINNEFVRSEAYDLWGYIFFFIIPPLCMILCYIFVLFRKYKFPILSYMGTYSLTIYLLHTTVGGLVIFINQAYTNTALLIAFIITMILAYPIQKLSYKIFRSENLIKYIYKIIIKPLQPK